MDRRRLLALLGAGAATGTAGCSTLGLPGGNDGPTTGDEGSPGSEDGPDDDGPTDGDDDSPGGENGPDDGGPAIDADGQSTTLGLSIGPAGRRYLVTEAAVHSVAADGTGRWTYENEDGVQTVLPGPELVYVGVEPVQGMVAGPTTVAALRPDDGTVEWTTPLEMRFQLFDAGDGHVYGGSIDDTGGPGHNRFALSRADGSRAWVHDDHHALSGLVADDRLHLTYFSKGVSAFGVTDGETLWEGDDVGSELAAAGDGVLAGGTPLTAYDGAGEVRWAFDADATPEGVSTYVRDWAVAPSGETVYAGGDDGSLSAIDVGTGAVRWHHRVTEGDGLSPVIAGPDGVYCAAGTDVVAVGADGPPIRWRESVAGTGGAEPRQLHPTDGTVFSLGTVDGFRRTLTAIDAASGDVSWRRDGEIVAVETAPDGSTLAVALVDGRLYSVTADQPLPSGLGTVTTTAGSDG